MVSPYFFDLSLSLLTAATDVRIGLHVQVIQFFFYHLRFLEFVLRFGIGTLYFWTDSNLFVWLLASGFSLYLTGTFGFYLPNFSLLIS